MDPKNAVLTDSELPEFRKPPVVETVLSASFRELPSFRTPQLIEFWAAQLRTDHPRVEERPRYGVPIERFGATGGVLNLELSAAGFPSPRYWFASDDGTHLVQLQTDWIAHNWRKTPTSPEYERYPAGRARFSELLRSLDSCMNESGGALVPQQCEVTYVNHIELDTASAPAHDVLKSLEVGHKTQGLLADPESVQLIQSYVIPIEGTPVGRLHVDVGPLQSETGNPVLGINLTARGRPLGEGIDGVLAFCDLGRSWIVEGFTELTTQTMHERWERLR